MTARTDSPHFDLAKLREQFPILTREVRGHPLVYLDNAATTLKPRVVLEAVTSHYESGASNIHRGVHFLSEEATKHYEGARDRIRSFINAPDRSQIILTTGTTFGINLVARSYAGKHFGPGDEILITHMEHHANIVPWQMLCEEKGCVLKVAPIDDNGALIMDEFKRLLSPRTKMVAFTYVSNSLGTINPAREIIALAHEQGALTLVDAAQAVAHMPIDVVDLDCDFLVFSGHKLYATSGVGVLYGKKPLLEATAPLIGGGDMIRSVTFEKTTYAPLPARLEAGTPPIGPTIGLGAAVSFVQEIGLGNMAEQENRLLNYATKELSRIPGLRLIGTAPDKCAILSFVVAGVHPHDLGSLLDAEGVAIRAGHHCTQPVMARYGVPATARASFAFYNQNDDVDRLVAAILKAKELFA